MSKDNKKRSTPKKSTKKSTVKKGQTPNENKASTGTSKINRYTKVQRILSDYCKANGHKLGRKFNAYASLINKKTEGTPIKEVENNIDYLYKIYVEGADVPKDFPNDFPFFEFADKLNSDPTYDGVMIGISFDDGTEKFEFKGLAMDMWFYYTENVHRYLRVNYNDSPFAWFQIKEGEEGTDGKTFVNYEIIVDRPMPKEETGGGTGGGTGKPDKDKDKDKEVPTPTPTPTPDGGKGASDNDVKVAKAKAEEEKAKAIAKALDLLMDNKITQEQFDRILKALEGK